METRLRAILPDHELMKMYEQMVLCREFEESCAEQYTKGHITGFLHLYSGQEAVAAGACAALRDDDAIAESIDEFERGDGATSDEDRTTAQRSRTMDAGARVSASDRETENRDAR